MLTPLDIESKVFARTLSGYSIAEVKQFMREVLTSYEKLYRDNIELRDKVNMLNEGIQYYKTIEDTLQSTLLLAERTSEDVKANARQKAEQIIKESELRADTIINDAQNEIYRISKSKESLVRAYDASKIQMRQFLKAQLELTNTTDLELNLDSYEDEIRKNNEASIAHVNASANNELSYNEYDTTNDDDDSSDNEQG
ncbi:MAG: DivIVA domain-containing protein [Vallitaleaceae bacterium]|jgi:cell division initiation protein|nr:DivIVA domain-containing protein [Vallitaleaceae bacterium]